ncbi:MAG: RNA polymerase sigma factor [Ignavibacteria bacterium]|nr:RNA polymerase sigma factor [Ignavibacteria bacterium]NCS90660.1 RNA polymerase sigma factor [Ignavibacteria bacterium]OIO24200.1 MAG: hypothetical protein AUJ54_00130 [Ignavibacteria bacterium CG1_02_37_35]PIS45059.1 MAG: hypothetical protein COT22_07260 [Ignavibacteria bacterium CG08_land_8_20_14_0_20_37_9]PJC60212.1 MAG: hypothetical protein CO025_03875 [Ignavibacteria bacterium CG_4_9_14_0_2_um_filter_37_13]
MQNTQIIDFTLVYNKHKKALYHYVLKITKSQMKAEDIVHDVFIKLFDNLSSIVDTNKIEFWVFKTARNLSLDHLRQIKRNNLRDVDIADCVNVAEDFAYTFEKNEIKEIIMNELNNMNPEQSEVFLLKEYSGMSYRQIAELMEISEELVKSRLYKVREKLKTVILNLNRGEL